MTQRNDSASSADRHAKRAERGPAPSALLVGPTRQYGSSEPWYVGVVLQQACQAMIRGGA